MRLFQLCSHVGMQLWPKLASWFGLEVGPPLRVPMATYMPFHKGAWEAIVKKHGLKDIPYERVRSMLQLSWCLHRVVCLRIG